MGVSVWEVLVTDWVVYGKDHVKEKGDCFFLG